MFLKYWEKNIQEIDLNAIRTGSINQHANALLIYSRAMHLDPPALIHIPSGETAVCSVVVILSDTNNCLFNLSSGILFGIWNTWKHHILFLALGLEHFFLHNVQGCPAALGNISKNYRAKKVKFKVVHCELRMPKEGEVESNIWK